MSDAEDQTKQHRQVIVDLDDESILDIAKENLNSPAHTKLMELFGPKTNPRWITGEAIGEAYDRDLIDELEMQWYQRQGGL